jgi:hypothetical protein
LQRDYGLMPINFICAFMPKDICRLLKIDAIGQEWFAARSETSRVYEPHRQMAIGDYIFDNADAERIFSQSPGALG